MGFLIKERLLKLFSKFELYECLELIFWQKNIPTGSLVEAYSVLEAKAKHVATTNLSNTHTIFVGLNNLWATHGNPRTLKS